MKLIKNLKTRKANNGQMRKYGLFLCPYCDEKVETRLSDGKRDKSCGCARKILHDLSITKHGDAHTGHPARLYRIWHNIKNRCYNGKHKSYKYYGKRGIIVCKQWKYNYISFKSWALSYGYKDNLTIDRKNNDGNYEPLNCRWVTNTINSRNKRTTKLNLKKAQQIRNLYFNIKITQKLLGKIFNVSRCTIGDIINDRCWR